MILYSEVPALIPVPPESNGFDCFVVYPTISTPYKAETSEPTVDFLFIHGITGSQTATWTAKNDQGVKVLWPRDFLPDKIPDCRVIMYGYDADVVNFWAEASQNRLHGHSRDLFVNLGRLRNDTETTSRPIIFVGATQSSEAPSETPDPGQEQPSELPDRPAQQGRGEHPKQQPAYFPTGQPAREEKNPKKSKKSKSTGPTFNFNKPRGGQWQVAGGDINNRGRAFGGKASNVEDDSEEDDSSEESAGDD